jgi:hypothetical protein
MFAASIDYYTSSVRLPIASRIADQPIMEQYLLALQKALEAVESGTLK